MCVIVSTHTHTDLFDLRPNTFVSFSLNGLGVRTQLCSSSKSCNFVGVNESTHTPNTPSVMSRRRIHQEQQLVWRSVKRAGVFLHQIFNLYCCLSWRRNTPNSPREARGNDGVGHYDHTHVVMRVKEGLSRACGSSRQCGRGQTDCCCYLLQAVTSSSPLVPGSSLSIINPLRTAPGYSLYKDVKVKQPRIDKKALQ